MTIEERKRLDEDVEKLREKTGEGKDICKDVCLRFLINPHIALFGATPEGYVLALTSHKRTPELSECERIISFSTGGRLTSSCSSCKYLRNGTCRIYNIDIPHGLITMKMACKKYAEPKTKKEPRKLMPGQMVLSFEGEQLWNI